MKSIIKKAMGIVAILIVTTTSYSCSKTDPCPEKYIEVYRSGQIELIFDSQEPNKMSTGEKVIFNDCEVSNIEVLAITDVTIRFEGAIISLKAGELKDLK